MAETGMTGPLPVAEFSTLLKALYAGPLEEPPWDSFLEAICVAMKAMAVTLILEPPASEGPGYIINASGRLHSGSRPYREQFFSSDPFVNLPEGRPVTISEYLPQEEFQASEPERFLGKNANPQTISQKTETKSNSQYPYAPTVF